MTPYRLGINIMTSGSGLRGLGGASAGMSSFGFSVANTNSHMGRFVNNMRSGSQAASQMGAAVRNAALAVAATGAGVAAAFIKTNADLESQRLAMTGLLNANLQFADARGKQMKAEGNFQKSMKASSKLMAGLEEDAMLGAGSTEDRILAFNAMLNTAVGQAGADLNSVRKLANQVVTTSKMISQLEVDPGQAARDADAILAGTAGVNTVLFNALRAQLGSAEVFNKLAAPERLAKFQAALNIYATPEQINAMANGYKGLSSTLQDMGTKIVRTMGKGVFERTKTGLQEIIWYYQKNTQAILDWSVALGRRIGEGLDSVRLFVKNTLMPMYQQAKPVIENVAGLIKKNFQQAIGFVTANMPRIVKTFQEVVGSVRQNMPLINAVFDLMTANARDAVGFFTQYMPVIQKTISSAFKVASPYIISAIRYFLELRTAFKEQLIPYIEYFTATFTDGMAVIQGWFEDNKELVADATVGYKAFIWGIVEGFRLAVEVSAQLVGIFGTIMGLGLGAALAHIAMGFVGMFAGYKRLYDYVSKYGVGGLIRDIGASFLMMKNDVLNSLDEVLKGFIDMARGLPGADKLFGLDKLSAEITNRQFSRSLDSAAGFSNARSDASEAASNVTIAPNVTIHQTIQTSDPQAAAATANRGVQRAVSRGVDLSKTGVPLTDPGLR